MIMERETLYNCIVCIIQGIDPRLKVTHSSVIGPGGLELDSLDVATVIIELEKACDCIVGCNIDDKDISIVQEWTIDMLLDNISYA